MSTYHSCEPGCYHEQRVPAKYANNWEFISSAPKALRNSINESRSLPNQKEEPKHQKNMKDDLKRREEPPGRYSEELHSRCTANINKDDCSERTYTLPHGVGRNLLHITHFV